MARAFKLWDGQGWYCLGGDGWHPPSLFHLYSSPCADILLHPHVSTSGGTLAIGRFGLTNHRLRTKEENLLSRTPVRRIDHSRCSGLNKACLRAASLYSPPSHSCKLDNAVIRQWNCFNVSVTNIREKVEGASSRKNSALPRCVTGE